MKTIRVWVKTNKIGSRCEDEFEIDEDASEEEIEEHAKEIMFNMIDWSFHASEK
jgi:hypothetical protein